MKHKGGKGVARLETSTGIASFTDFTYPPLIPGRGETSTYLYEEPVEHVK